VTCDVLSILGTDAGVQRKAQQAIPVAFGIGQYHNIVPMGMKGGAVQWQVMENRVHPSFIEIREQCVPLLP
jgi:hypothetical protein